MRFRFFLARWLLVGAMFGGTVDGVEGAQPGTLGMNDSWKIEDLPLLRTGVQTHQLANYDRSGDNYDWDYFVLYTEPNGEVVFFDATGPGCLYRQQMNLWMSGGQIKEDTKGVNIRYYFDDETKPRIDMDVSLFFSEKNPLGIFHEPLSINGGVDFRTVYCPMYFKKRLKIALSREPGGPATHQLPWMGRYDKVLPRWHWYQFTYHTFTEDQGLPSWTPGQVAHGLASLWDPKKLGQDPKPTAGNREINKTIDLAPGAKTTLAELAGPGSIAGIQLSVEPLAEEALYQTWIIMTWDGGQPAQVEMPLGVFFGGYRKTPQDAFSSLLFGYSPKSMYCYFPMPYWKSAKIEIENRGRQPVQAVRASVQYKPADAEAYSPADCGYFYANYHREFPRTEGHDYTYLDWQGRGHVVAHATARYDTSMEENERTYFDGNHTPQIFGNGFEDDHNMGWGLKNRRHAVYGVLGADGGAGGVYRLFLPDLYYFQDSVKHGHQAYGPHSPRGHEGMYQVGNEESVAFFYGRPSPGIALTDQLDVGNKDSEAAHAYRVTGDRKEIKGKYWYDGEFNNVLFATPPIEDDGASFAGSSQFTVKIDPANSGVRLRRRLDKAMSRQMAAVYVDGVKVAERPWYNVDCEKTYRDIRWVESDFEIPAKYTKGKNSITVKIENLNGPSRAWNEFFYWVFSYKNGA
jgi:hypothetical protein